MPASIWQKSSDSKRIARSTQVIGQNSSQDGFEIALIAETTPGAAPDLYGRLDPRGRYPCFASGTAQPLRHGLQNGETMFVSNLEGKCRVAEYPLLRSGGQKLRLPAHSKCSGANQDQQNTAPGLRSGNQPHAGGGFHDEDEQLFNLLARQVSLALQNIGLLEEATRRLNEVNLLLDFSRQLGGLTRQASPTRW
jgi:hypothetical protein